MTMTTILSRKTWYAYGHGPLIYLFHNKLQQFEIAERQRNCNLEQPQSPLKLWKRRVEIATEITVIRTTSGLDLKSLALWASEWLTQYDEIKQKNEQ